MSNNDASRAATVRERLIERYAAFKVTNPDVSYAEWCVRAELDSVNNGKPHATLGPRLRKFENWWDAGTGTFRRYQRWFPFVPSSKVVDYGCGSLRVGSHFIRFLDPECYFGMDVIPGFYEIGQELIGTEMMAEKKPRFAVIGDEAVREAAAFAPDFVYSSAVSYHVHPDEVATYFGNLSKICWKPGADLFFDVSMSSGPINSLLLSEPLDFFKSVLPDLNYITYHEIERVEDKDQTIGVLHFRRPAATGAA